MKSNQNKYFLNPSTQNPRLLNIIKQTKNEVKKLNSNLTTLPLITGSKIYKNKIL